MLASFSCYELPHLPRFSTEQAEEIFYKRLLTQRDGDLESQPQLHL